MSPGIPDDFRQPTVAPPEQSSEGLSAGEIAAIVVVLTIAVVVALLVGIIVFLYYMRKRRYKWLVNTAVNPSHYVSDADTFNGENTPGDEREVLVSSTMVMTSKESTLPAQSFIATNEVVIKRESQEASAHVEGDSERGDNLKSEVIKDNEDTHL